MISQFYIFRTILFFSCHFFHIQLRRKPAHDRQHPRRKQVTARTLTFRGPGAGICRRQLRWYRNQLSDPQNRKFELAGLPLEPLKSNFASDFRNRSKQSRTSENLQNSRQRNFIVAICRFTTRQQLQQTHAPKRRATKWGAAVLAPHGAFG